MSNGQCAAFLRDGRDELVEATLARVYGVSDPSQIDDPEYVLGLRQAVAAAIDYAITGIEAGFDRFPSIPSQLGVQARAAARNDVSLDTVLRRCFAGNALLLDFLMEGTERSGSISRSDLKGVLRLQSILLDRLVAFVSEEYAKEAKERAIGGNQRRNVVKMLLAGEPVGADALRYDLAAWHIGVLAAGPSAAKAVRSLARELDRRLLLVEGDERSTVWAWLGGAQRIAFEDFEGRLEGHWPEQIPLAIGEPTEDLSGWRRTHLQARAALPIALRNPKKVVRYAEVALLASIIQDDLLSNSLRDIYLAPLDGERDGGESLRETLRAYFAADRNVSSAAAVLRVSRRTVANRLYTIEEKLGRSLSSVFAEVEVALRLADLNTYSQSAWPAAEIKS